MGSTFDGPVGRVGNRAEFLLGDRSWITSDPEVNKK